MSGHGPKFGKFITTENDTMAVGDGGNASGENPIENDANHFEIASLEEQKSCLKQLLMTPLKKGETW